MVLIGGPDVDGDDAIVAVLRHRKLNAVRVAIVGHDDAHERPAADGVARVQRHRQEAVGGALDEGGQPLGDLRVVLAQVHPALPQHRLHVARHLLARPRRRLRENVEGEHQHVADGVLTRRRRPLARARPNRAPAPGTQLADDGRAAQLELGAARHQLALPLDRTGRRAARRLRHHADRHVQQHLGVGLVLGGELQQLRVELRAHLGRQQVRPAHVRHLAQALEALLDERVGRLRAAEQYSNNTSPLRQVAPAGERAQVAQRVRVVLARRQHQPAQGGHPRVQASLPVPLPVRPPALARAVQMGAVVAALVAPARLRQRGRRVAARIAALQQLMLTAAMTSTVSHAVSTAVPGRLGGIE
uniref:Uncharacterized protein n=1 Tax=Anopheles atroparvus TaxID=41427 RepID=A0A182IK94_ANOAO